MYVCRSHLCPRFGNSWQKKKPSSLEYVLRDTRYYEISLLLALLNSRVLVGATNHVIIYTAVVLVHRSERFGSHCYRRQQ